MGELDFEWWPHAELHYRVLSHLDLGRDAANLFDAGAPRRPWSARLRRLYRRAPGRLVLQIAPLLATDLGAELRMLRDEIPPPLDDRVGRQLCASFAGALERLAPQGEADLGEESAASRARREAFAESSGATLELLRDILYLSSNREPPRLRVIDCPSLGDGAFTHGRAMVEADGARIVAVSLAGDPVQAALQIFHEEIHPITDPPIRARSGGTARETEVGSAGYELHRALEREAVEVGGQIIERYVPTLVEDYHRWRGRFGM